jgi:hypothetical protein
VLESVECAAVFEAEWRMLAADIESKCR